MTSAVAIGLAKVVDILFNMVQIVIIASVILSWVNADPRNQIVQMLNTVSEFLFKPFRPLASKIPGPLDWTPFVALLVFIFLHTVIINLLRGLA